MIPEFGKLSVHDQTNLLRRSGMHMGILRGSIIFDFEKRMITSKDGENYPDIRVSYINTYCRRTHLNFVHISQEINSLRNNVEVHVNFVSFVKVSSQHVYIFVLAIFVVRKELRC